MSTSLTDDELRVKVAGLMGWGFEWEDAHSENKNVTVRRPGGWLIGRFYVNVLPPCIIEELPNYPASVDAALTLCDRLRSEGWTVQINGFVTEGWYCSFHKGEVHYSVSDPSLARAICLAFLKAQGVLG